MSAFQEGDHAVKDSGDYHYSGVVVSVFRKLSGAVRLVVENADGVLFIFNEKQLRKAEP